MSEAAVGMATPLMVRWRALLELGKPRLTTMVVLAVVAGAYMGYPLAHPPFDLVVAVAIGTFLVSAGGSALNQHLERHLDAKMLRTQGRPLPSGRVAPREAIMAGGIAVVVGLLILALFTNLLATVLCALITVLYVGVYTPMKRHTPLCTLVGAIPGALPPVVGHVAVAERLSGGALVLFLILFCWQIPHFFAIAWRYRDDYARADMKMLPVVDPSGQRTSVAMVLYVCGLVIASMLPFTTRMAGEIYLGAAVCLNVLFFVPTMLAAFWRWQAAMRMTFLVSLIYLPLLLLVMVLDRAFV